MKEQKYTFAMDRIYPDALINLFVGIFAGSILYAIQKVHFFEIQGNLQYLLLLVDEVIYLIYLVYGYFTLFRVYHYNAIFFEKDYVKDGKNLIKFKFISLAVVVGLLAILPRYFSISEFIKFYPILSIILAFDIVWIYSYCKLLESTEDCSYIINGYFFDISGILISLFSFVILSEWQEAIEIFGEEICSGVILGIHIFYFAPFLSFFLRSK